MKRWFSVLIIGLLLSSMLASALNIQLVEATATIYIRADGSVDPPTASITSADNVTYTLTDNISDSIRVERSNIIIDGAGYTLQGSSTGYGFWCEGINNVTVKNTNIKNFYNGVYLSDSSSNSISGNNITANTGNGIALSNSSSNSISGNNITNNGGGGGEPTLRIFGNDVIGLNRDSDSTWCTGQGFIAPEDGIAESISLYVDTTSSTLNGSTFVLAMYGEVNSFYALLGVTSEIIVGNDFAGFITANLLAPVELYAGNKYFLSWWQTAPSGAALARVTGGGEYRSRNPATIPGGWPNFPDPWNPTYSEDALYTVYCTYTPCARGISLFSSSNNRIYHNNFINNPIPQVYLRGGSANIWDDGYSSGGNYWSDYTGADLYRGPYQNETGKDGIGDTSYVIDASNTDYYPLMNSWPDTTSPTINILSPQNTTYPASSVPLTFTVNEGTSWTGYSLDNQANVTIVGNTTLTDLVPGSHDVIIYANDTWGNTGSSDEVFFSYLANDVAILNVTASPTETYVDQIVNINVTVRNKGTVSETFNVTVYYDSNIIDTQSVVNLAPSSSTTITFSWNTSGVPKGIYTISAEAEAIPGETNTTDNIYIDHIVTIQNSPPTIVSQYPQISPSILEGQSQDFNITKLDLDGDPLTVTWWLNQTDTLETSDSYTYNANYESAGTYNVTVVVSDGLSQTSHQWTLTVANVERDIAIINLTLSKSIVGEGHPMSINVTITNQGELTETFNVTAYDNASVIGVQNVALNPGENQTLTFVWDTTDWTKGNYSIIAVADTVPGESDTADNTFDRWAFVTLAGDVDGNRQVNIFDIVKMAGVYGVKLPDPRYAPNCDIDGDGDIDIFDIVIAAGHYGKSW